MTRVRIMFRHLSRVHLAPASGLLRGSILPDSARVSAFFSVPTSTSLVRPVHTAPEFTSSSVLPAQDPIPDLASATLPTAAPTSTPTADPDFDTLVHTHPLLTTFRAAHPSLILSRSALVPPAPDVPNNLTCATLSGPDLIFPRPYVFTAEAAGAVLAFYRLGKKLAGHSGIVHGGVTAALLDECMCRACFAVLPRRIAVTVRLNVEYKSPVRVGSGVVVMAETVRVEGRKAWVRARVKDAVGGEVRVEAEGLFVEPRWAGEMVGIY